MTEIQRLLSETIDDLNIREKRDNRPRFSISFIRLTIWQSGCRCFALRSEFNTCISFTPV